MTNGHFDPKMQVKNSYYLVSLVENDYINGDIFAVFADL